MSRDGTPRSLIAASFLAIALLLIASCSRAGEDLTANGDTGQAGQGEETDDGQTEGGASATLPSAELILRGTEKQPVPDGYVEIPGACTESTENNPSLGMLSVYVPEEWGPASGATGLSGDSGLISFFVVDGAQVDIEARMLYPDWQNDDQPHPDSVLNALGETETVGTVTWGGEEVEVVHNGRTYAALLPIMEVVGEAPGAPTGPHLMSVQVLELFEDDAATRDTILTVIETMASHECAADWYSGAANLEVIVES